MYVFCSVLDFVENGRGSLQCIHSLQRIQFQLIDNSKWLWYYVYDEAGMFRGMTVLVSKIEKKGVLI